MAFVLPPLLVGVAGAARGFAAQRPEAPPPLTMALPERPAHDSTRRLDLVSRPLALGLVGLALALWLRRRLRPALRPPGRFGLHFAEISLAMVAAMLLSRKHDTGGHARAGAPQRHRAHTAAGHA